ncbi:aminotransferase class V-fold PLP-dependent enzyme [Hoeflea sp.]|uniref:aminotransferase class V-fold PLP-dependent enzyme n=1 Tax=Hoeflea sp. TaxID=1940281 RepID=UPI0019CF3F52|nr:aminotransferase class V-fold PLP-dependent enzyme [Hoeflea sp.]MBC7284244.1 aminotransferase class V-fold PLP-dependent enzyme [Hoeflea sp.]
MNLFPRMVLDYGASDLARLLARGGHDAAADLAAIDRELARGRPFAMALSVRTSLDLLLSCLSVQPGDEIILSAVTVPGMAEIAHHHGLVVRVVDIDPDSLTVSADDLRALVNERTRVAVLAPLFGSHGDLSEHALVCRERKVVLVEDAAQAWDGEYRGSMDADVVFFSFGPAKTATALAGAVVVFRDQDMARRFARMQAELPAQSAGWLFYRVAKFGAVLLFRGPRRLGFIARLAALTGRDPDIFIGSMAKGFAGQGLIARIRHRLPEAVRSLIAHKLRTHPGAAQRKARARQFIAMIDPGLTVPGRANPSTSYWLLPVCVADPSRLVGALRARGYDASRGASSLAAIIDDRTGRPCTKAQQMMDSLVYVPLTRYTGEDEMRQMAKIIKRHARAVGTVGEEIAA